MVPMDLIVGHVLFALTFAQLVPCEYGMGREQRLVCHRMVSLSSLVDRIP